MKKLIYTSLLALMSLTACKQNQTGQISDKGTLVTAPPAGPAASDAPEMAATETDCVPGEKLLYEDAGFSAFTEDKIRGEGIISFVMDVNDRLDFYNMDGSVFGALVLNQDMTYYTLDMPQKTIARKLITNFDFAAFDFDAENTAADKDYLIVYVNKEKRKVKKSAAKFTFRSWNEYLKNNTVTLKDCSPLKDEGGKTINTSKGQAFIITEVKNDMVKVKSSKECTGDGTPYKDQQGWVKWKSTGGALLIDPAICN